MLERPIAPGLRHTSVFLPICPQDKLPSHSLWAERQSSRSCYRITVVFNDTVFYMWFSHPNSNHWNHPLSFNSCVCTFITHNCAALWRSLLLQHPLCPSFSSPSKGLSFLTFKKNNKKKRPHLITNPPFLFSHHSVSNLSHFQWFSIRNDCT